MRRTGYFMFLAVGSMATFVAITTVASLAGAATIGYWRFESEENFLKDSGPNGLDLTVSGSPAPSYVSLPESGKGADFYNPIPQTQEANTGAAKFQAVNQITGACLSREDNPLFSLHDFTIECFFNRNSAGWTVALAGQNDYTSGQFSWQFGVRGAGFNSCLYLLLYDNVGYQVDVNSPSSIVASELDHDYYAAVSFDESEQTGGVTFYLKDLTAGTAMQKAVVNHTVNSLFDATSPFTIGGAAAVNNYISGMIDEVKLSGSVLAGVELLVPDLPTKPGDANNDSYVDGADAALLAENWLKSSEATWEEGDFNDDGMVNDIDATILAANWTGSPQTPWASASVPEPGTLGLMGSLAAGLLFLRQRRV